jgi:hypothetical protein
VITNELYLAGLFSDPSTTKNFTPSKVSDCPDLFSNHKEADTRMLLQAIHADARVTIRFDLPNQSLRRIVQVVALCLTSSRCKSEGKL